MLKVVSIGASAGGVDALKILLPAFTQKDFAVLVVLHMPPAGPNLLPSLYQDLCSYKIKEAEPGELLLGETIYIAPPDYHLCAEPDGTLSLSSDSPVKFSRPSIDVMMESVALVYKKQAVGILLTGSSDDGVSGMQQIKKYGGTTLVQDPDTAEFSIMPASCINTFKPDHVLNLPEIKKYILSMNDSGALNG